MFTHEEVERETEDQVDWPIYFKCGEETEETTPAYYRVEGANGPVSWTNRLEEVYTTTMYDFAMEAQSSSFEWVERESTPWPEIEKQNRE